MNSGKRSELTDEALLALINQDDARAFEALFDRHSGVAFSLALHVLRDRGLAADATQDAFLAVWRHRASYRPADGLARSWLLGIVRHRAIDILRRERARRPRPADGREFLERPADRTTEDRALAGEEQRAIRSLLDALPSEQRLVIELAYYQGLTHTEIAELLGLPLGTAKGRIRLALEKLRIGLRGSRAEPALM